MLAKALKTISIAAVLTLTLTACVSSVAEPVDVTLDSEFLNSLPTPNVTPNGNIKDKPDVNWTTLEEFYGQSLDWVECGEGEFLCSPVFAPKDWDNPSAGLVYLALFKQKATGEPMGTLLVNPGGPGASGIDLLYFAGDYITTAAVREKYDVVGFDPRGVGYSDAIYCGDGELLDRAFLSPGEAKDVGSAKSLAEAQEIGSRLAQACEQGSGDLLGYVDTISSARDMDLIRHLVGDEKLNFLGFSYGTQLGATYAALYPENVGRLVLDAAVDPTQSKEEGTLGQAGGFELAFGNFVDNCLKTNTCPGEGTTKAQVLSDVKKFLESLESKPLPTKLDLDLSVWMGLTGIIANLYSKGNWSELATALDAGFNGDGTPLLRSTYRYFERNETGEYMNNLFVANVAINCMDGRYSQDPKAIEASNKAIYAATPTFGKYFANPHISCYNWKYPAKDATKLDYRVKLNYPVLVIGTTGDPATPYKNAVGLSKLLNRAVLITYEGEGHTVYAGNSACVDNTVDAYLLEGIVPEESVTCKN